MDRRGARPRWQLPAAVIVFGLLFVLWAPPLAAFTVAALTASFWCAWLDA